MIYSQYFETAEITGKHATIDSKPDGQMEQVSCSTPQI
jgi:hypothetical protein